MSATQRQHIKIFKFSHGNGNDLKYLLELASSYNRTKVIKQIEWGIVLCIKFPYTKFPDLFKKRVIKILYVKTTLNLWNFCENICKILLIYLSNYLDLVATKKKLLTRRRIKNNNLQLIFYNLFGNSYLNETKNCLTTLTLPNLNKIHRWIMKISNNNVQKTDFSISNTGYKCMGLSTAKNCSLIPYLYWVFIEI